MNIVLYFSTKITDPKSFPGHSKQRIEHTAGREGEFPDIFLNEFYFLSKSQISKQSIFFLRFQMSNNSKPRFRIFFSQIFFWHSESWLAQVQSIAAVHASRGLPREPVCSLKSGVNRFFLTTLHHAILFPTKISLFLRSIKSFFGFDWFGYKWWKQCIPRGYFQLSAFPPPIFIIFRTEICRKFCSVWRQLTKSTFLFTQKIYFQKSYFWISPEYELN